MTDKKSILGEVTLRNVRMSYGYIFKPSRDSRGDDGTLILGKYKSNFLMDPKSKVGADNLERLNRAKEEVMQVKWGDRQPKIKTNKYCVTDGNEVSGEEYQGMFFVKASNTKGPGEHLGITVIDNRKDLKGMWIELKEEDGRPYSGCYVNAIVRVYAHEVLAKPEIGKAVWASLESIQFLRHGERFGAAPPVDPNEKFTDEDLDGADFPEIGDVLDEKGDDMEREDDLV